MLLDKGAWVVIACLLLIMCKHAACLTLITSLIACPMQNKPCRALTTGYQALSGAKRTINFFIMLLNKATWVVNAFRLFAGSHLHCLILMPSLMCHLERKQLGALTTGFQASSGIKDAINHF